MGLTNEALVLESRPGGEPLESASYHPIAVVASHPLTTIRRADHDECSARLGPDHPSASARSALGVLRIRDGQDLTVDGFVGVVGLLDVPMTLDFLAGSPPEPNRRIMVLKESAHCAG